jgi:hypothetical protein
MENKTNVVPINRSSTHALFNNDLRQRLESGISGKTEKPEEIVDTIESIICTYLVLAIRRVAASIGEKIGDGITKQVEKVVK